MSKGEQRSDLLLVKPAIAYVHAFAVGGFSVHALVRALGVLGVGGGVVFQTLTPGDGQPAGGAALAGEQIGCRPAALIAGPPHFQYRLYLVHPGQGDGLASVQHDDGVGVNRGHLFDELVLLAGKAEDRAEASPHEYYRYLGALRGGDGGFVVGLALLGRVPVEAHLHGRIGAVGAGLDLNLVWTGGQMDYAAHVIESVGGGNHVVLVSLQNVAMHASLLDAGSDQPLAVEGDLCIGPKRLQVEPVHARVRRGERALPGNGRVGRQSSCAGELDLRVDLFGVRAATDQSRLAVVVQRVGRDERSGHVVVHGEFDVGVAGDLPES